jgi:hypothetical protein
VQRDDIPVADDNPVKEDSMVPWRSLWRLTGTPRIQAHDLQPLRNGLDLAAREDRNARRAAEALGPTVHWVANEHLTAGPAVAAVLIELVDLLMAYDATTERTRKAALCNDIANAILMYAQLTNPGEPAKNSRCSCGSGKKYKQCHGAGSVSEAAEPQC